MKQPINITWVDKDEQTDEDLRLRDPGLDRKIPPEANGVFVIWYKESERSPIALITDYSRESIGIREALRQHREGNPDVRDCTFADLLVAWAEVKLLDERKGMAQFLCRRLDSKKGISPRLDSDEAIPVNLPGPWSRY